MHKKQNLKDFGSRAVADPELAIREGPGHPDLEIREGPGHPDLEIREGPGHPDLEIREGPGHPDLEITEGPGHPDLEIREGPVSKKNFSAPRASVWSNNKWRARGPQAPPLDPQLQGV